MRTICVGLALLACTGYGSHLRRADSQRPTGHLDGEDRLDASRSLAKLVLASNPTAAFNPSTVTGMRPAVSDMRTNRLGESGPVLGGKTLGATKTWFRQKDASNSILFIDGNNLMGQPKVTKGRTALTDRLKNIKRYKPILVFDGAQGEQESMTGEDPQVVITRGADENGNGRQTADDWIVEACKVRKEKWATVITCDAGLTKAAKAVKVMGKKKAQVISSKRFWRRYMARLTGIKGKKKKELVKKLQAEYEARQAAASPEPQEA